MRRHNIPEYDEMLDRLDAHDLDGYFDASDRMDDRIDAISRELFDAARRSGCVLIDAHGDDGSIYASREHRHYLHVSTRYAGCLQLTAWDCDGPICDVRIRDARDLADELRHSVGSAIWYDLAA